jgi:hypothetical protein
MGTEQLDLRKEIVEELKLEGSVSSENSSDSDEVEDGSGDWRKEGTVKKKKNVEKPAFSDSS